MYSSGKEMCRHVRVIATPLRDGRLLQSLLSCVLRADSRETVETRFFCPVNDNEAVGLSGEIVSEQKPKAYEKNTLEKSNEILSLLFYPKHTSSRHVIVFRTQRENRTLIVPVAARLAVYVRTRSARLYRNRLSAAPWTRIYWFIASSPSLETFMTR